MISQRVYHSIYGNGTIADFQFMAGNECVGIDFDSIDSRKYYHFPASFFVLEYFSSNENEQMRRMIKEGFFIGKSGYSLEYSTLLPVILRCYNCKEQYVYQTEERIANVKKNRLPPRYCPKCRELLPPDKKKANSNLGEIINAMWHENPRRIKKPWYFHNTYGMHIDDGF